MADSIRFEDGAAYDRYMGKWSELVGEAFLDWLAPRPALRWLDVGCGSGAFTAMLVARCAPVAVQGIDPSEGQLAYARARAALRTAQFCQGDAMALPFRRRHLRCGGHAAGDLLRSRPGPGRRRDGARGLPRGPRRRPTRGTCSGVAFPYEALKVEMRGLGVVVPEPPSPGASGIDALRELWAGAGLEAIETRQISRAAHVPELR